MSKKFLKIAGVLLPLMSAMYSPSAHAQCDGCVVAAVVQLQAAVQGHFSALTAADSLNTQRIVGAISGSTATISSQTARAAEMAVQGNQRTEAAMEQNRQDARYQVVDACAVLANTRGASEASRSAIAQGGGVGRGSRVKPTGVSSDMAKALNVAAGTVPAPSPEVQSAQAASGACSSFVSTSANDVRAKTCTLAGFTASASNGHPDADIRAETLFDGPQKGTTASQFRRRLTIDANGAEASATNAYLRNLNTPIDLRQLEKAELRTDQGRQYMAFRDAYEARMSLAEKPARSMVADRFANKALLPVVEQLLASPVTGPFVKSYLNRNYPKWKSNGISLDELTNLEAERRYMNRNWHLLMASAPPEAHVKEQTTMLAFQAVLMNRILNKLNEQAVLTGQTSATLVRQEMLPQLIQLHSSAAK